MDGRPDKEASHNIYRGHRILTIVFAYLFYVLLNALTEIIKHNKVFLQYLCRGDQYAICQRLKNYDYDPFYGGV